MTASAAVGRLAAGLPVTTARVSALVLLVLGQVGLAGEGQVGPVGWVVGLTAAAVLLHLVDVGAEHTGRTRLSAADLVTLTRAGLGCLVAALTAESLTGRAVTAPLVTTAAMALALDAVDGPVARRTGTVSRFGARFDGETDAALILVLGVAAGSVAGWWLVAAGVVRYAFGAAGLARPWLGAALPFRYWRKVVAAAAGVGLTVLATGLLPSAAALVVGLVVLGLLAESFGRDVLWLWRRRAPAAPTPDASAPEPRRRIPLRRNLAHVLAAALLVLAWCALLLPGRPDRLSLAGTLRLPVEAVAVAAALVVTPDRWRRAVATVLGLGLGLVVLARLLDLGSAAVLDRPFDVVTDLSSLGPGLSFLRDSQGPVVAAGAVVAVVGLLALVVLGTPWALARTARAAGRRRRRSAVVVAAAAAGWALLAATGVRGPAGTSLAAADGAPYVVSEVTSARAALADAATFRRELADDPLGSAASTDLAGLRGKDVLLVVVESYGRVALEGDASAPLRDQLDAATGTLAAAGFGARSGWLTSSTFGAGSWFAHSTLQSGLWVDRQSRYDALLASSRPTLSSVFARDGWRTVAVVPSTVGSWPQGRAFYRFDRVYGRDDLGYAGPTFGFSTMPDQYALAALQRLELAPRERRGGPPVMAQVELTSSHAPWAPLPTTVPAETLGDGRVFGPVAARARSAAQLWQDPSQVPAAYRTSVAYSLRSVVDLVAAAHDDDLVVLVVGDHQPSTVVTGPGAGHDVPVTVVAHDPAVLRAVEGWGWTPGLRPGAGAPVWRMDALRDRVLTTFSSPAAGPR
ncbi:CDP-alcohol phosphatidyltransferase family protein [Lapillicoccus jejuensis]|uniref:CDP-alcohol phosphatidyltransferase-like enzyme n=1 Tax=Lapillicoccus jejuensis TaxID=402171 RepID=A0A542DZG7_9MICO|nr:CDP-alcohol phosphatidyltransferase family protein [Lapillicoccus jejuensis]TQJ08478.1 CDP-alcohol phosphatidyltransferase-like enzyme [Lapillicoccus jejuensis]